MKNSSFKPHFDVIVGCVLYGTFGIFLEHIRAMSAGSILFYRLLFGLFALLFYFCLAGGWKQLKLGKNWKCLVLLAILNTLTSLGYFISIKLSGLSIAVLLLYTAPVYVSFLAPLLLGEKSSKNLFPLFLALVGVLLVARPESLLETPESGIEPTSFPGLIAGLLSGLAFSGVILATRYLKEDYTGLAKTFWVTALGLVLMFPFALFTPLPLIFENFNPLLFLGFTATLAVLLHMKGFSGLSAKTGSILALLEPVFGILFDHVLLKNPLYSSTIEGCFCILAAATLVSFEGFTRKKRALK
ncbi:MAG: DMT family transporter [Methanosarcinaceae archaeon]|nr:DMT family transporter [Methanosarcinaceae archaeon]